MDPILLAMRNRAVPVARPPARAIPRPPARRPPITAATAPVPPNFRALLEQLAAGAPQRTEADWTTMLDARTAPFTSAINASTDQARAMNEYRYETKAAANQGLGSAFLGMLTGGRTGAEAEAYSKENFGGSYLGAQAMSMAADALRELTADFDEGDYKISGQYLEAMQQVPAIREELRATLEKQDMDEHTRKVTVATLLMDETWRAFEHTQSQYQFGVGAAETKRLNSEQILMARERLGLDTYKAGTSAKSAEIRAGELELRQAKAAYAKSKDKVTQRQAQERINLAKGNLEVAKLNAKKNASTSSGAQKAEADLGIKVLTTERDTIRDIALGKPSASGFKGAGGSYADAYEYVYALAEAELSQYGRGKGYINAWVRARLRSLGIGKTDPKPRGG